MSALKIEANQTGGKRTAPKFNGSIWCGSRSEDMNLDSLGYRYAAMGDQTIHLLAGEAHL